MRILVRPADLGAGGRCWLRASMVVEKKSKSRKGVKVNEEKALEICRTGRRTSDN